VSLLVGPERPDPVHERDLFVLGGVDVDVIAFELRQVALPLLDGEVAGHRLQVGVEVLGFEDTDGGIVADEQIEGGDGAALHSRGHAVGDVVVGLDVLLPVLGIDALDGGGAFGLASDTGTPGATTKSDPPGIDLSRFWPSLLSMQAPAKDTDRYFEAIEEGETYGVADARTITEADVVNFAGISSDFHPLHMSTVAAEASDFEGRIAHGNLVFSVAEAMVADMNPKSFSYGYDTLRFVNPVLIGDTLSVTREVVATEEYSDDLGRVAYEYEVGNEDGETVLACTHITLVERET
jgi:acyl dehydratase